MPVQIIRNELPIEVQDNVINGILSAIGTSEGFWGVHVISDPLSNAWDIDIQGPDGFYWARRFSGLDRDPEVISEAIRNAVLNRAA
jgi:hypothetical protein